MLIVPHGGNVSNCYFTNMKYLGVVDNNMLEAMVVPGTLTILTFNLQEIKAGHYLSDEPGKPFKYKVRPSTLTEMLEYDTRN